MESPSDIRIPDMSDTSKTATNKNIINNRTKLNNSVEKFFSIDDINKHW